MLVVGFAWLGLRGSVGIVVMVMIFLVMLFYYVFGSVDSRCLCTGVSSLLGCCGAVLESVGYGFAL